MRIVELTGENLYAFENYIYPDAYRRILDGSAAIALGLVEKTYACGAAVGFLLNGGADFFINSLYVDESMRMYGGGSLLFSGMMDRLPGGVRRINASYSVEEALSGAMRRILLENGFEEPEKVSDIYYIKGASIKGTALFPTGKKLRDRSIIPLFSLDKEILEKLSEDGEIPDYLDYRIDEDDADRDGSLAYVKNGRVAAYVIFKPIDGNTLLLTAAYTEKGSKGLFLKLIPECVKTLAEKYGEETVCVISALDGRVAALIEKLSMGRIEARRQEFKAYKFL